MARVDLLGGTYEARSIIADAQRCVNLYPEKNPKDAGAPVTHYLTPGLTLLATPPVAAPGRGLYTATNGQVFYVCGISLFVVDGAFNLSLIGTLSINKTTPVSMVDNSTVLVLVDGSAVGYAVRLSDLAFAQITDPSFLGADKVDYVDTFFIFNQPNTRFFYTSLSNCTYEQLTSSPPGGVIAGRILPSPNWYVDGTYVNVPLVYAPNTLVDSNGGILALGVVNGGVGYINGTYSNVSLTGGSGSGATADIIVTGGAATGVTLVLPGTGYVASDVLSAAPANLGGSGSGFTINIGGSGARATIVVSKGKIVSCNVTAQGGGYTSGDVLGIDNPAMGVPTLIILTAGSGGANATYTNVKMTGGVGGGMLATVVVAGGLVTTITVTDPGQGYDSADQVSFKPADAGNVLGFLAQVVPGTITTAGSGYNSNNSGTFDNTAMLGGTGTGMQNQITVVKTTGAIGHANPSPGFQGTGYVVGDVLTINPADVNAKVNDATGSGFTYTVNALPYGFGYQLGTLAAFDPTYVAGKVGFPDLISTIACVHREIWLFGAFKTTEVWYDSGNPLFPFAILPGVFIEQGCVAKYSVVKHDLLVFWLGIDANGQGTVFMGAGYAAHKISTPAISYAFTTYDTISDAVGMSYMQGDHVFYLLSFPTANKTWVFDVSEELWHERTWTNPDDGSENRHRANAFTIGYGKIICSDWETGLLYQVDLQVMDDNGAPIVRRRGLPHITNEMKRVSYNQFVANMECGRGIPDPAAQPQINLRISDTRGRTWWDAPTQSLGAVGQYYVVPMWRQVGLARDRVFELYWSDPVPTALNNAFVEVSQSET